MVDLSFYDYLGFSTGIKNWLLCKGLGTEENFPQVTHLHYYYYIDR